MLTFSVQLFNSTKLLSFISALTQSLNSVIRKEREKWNSFAVSLARPTLQCAQVDKWYAWNEKAKNSCTRTEWKRSVVQWVKAHSPTAANGNEKEGGRKRRRICLINFNAKKIARDNFYLYDCRHSQCLCTDKLSGKKVMPLEKWTSPPPPPPPLPSSVLAKNRNLIKV